MTLWQQVSDALEAALRQIDTAAGYRTSIGARLRPWQAEPPRWEDLPVMEVRAGTVTPDRPAYGRQVVRVGAQVVVLLPGGTDPAVIRDHAADVVQALGADPTLGGTADDVVVTSVAVDPGEPERVSDGLVIELSVEAETDPWTL